jgi:hypothetical protein
VERADRNQRLLASKTTTAKQGDQAQRPRSSTKRAAESTPEKMLTHNFLGVQSLEQAEAIMEASKAMLKVQRVSGGLVSRHDLYKSAAALAIASKALENLLATSPNHYITIEGYKSKDHPEHANKRIASVEKALRVFAKYDRDDNVEKPFLVRLFEDGKPEEQGWVYVDMHPADLTCVIADDSNLDDHLTGAEAVADMLQPT